MGFQSALIRRKKTTEIKDAEQRRKWSTLKQTCRNSKEHATLYWNDKQEKNR